MGPMAHSEGCPEWWREGFCTKEIVSCHCLQGCVHMLVSKLQAHLSLLHVDTLGLTFCQLRLLAGFLQGQGRDKGACSACATLVSVLHSGISHGFQPPTLGGTPSTSFTAPTPQRSLFSSGDLSSEPLGLMNCSLLPALSQPKPLPPAPCSDYLCVSSGSLVTAFSGLETDLTDPLH